MATPVLTFGEFLIDLIATGDATSLLDARTLEVRPGGAPVNVAVALVRQGVPAAVCSVVGADPFGDRLLGVLDAHEVDRTRVRQTSEADTTLAFAWKDERGDGHFRILRQADILLNNDDVERAGIDGATAIVVGSVALSGQPSREAIETAVRRAKEAGVPVCFDVNMRPAIWSSRADARRACEPILGAATLLKLSMDDARFMLGLPDEPDVDRVFEMLQAFECAFIVLTDGARGAWFSNRTAAGYTLPVHLPPFDIESVEPTGAGDAFMAGIIRRLIDSRWTGLTEGDVRYASAAGALTTTRPGAIDSLPSQAEIASFLDQQMDRAGA